METEGSLTSLPPVSVLSLMNPIHTPKDYFLRSILILSSHLHLGISSSFFPSGFPTQVLYEFLIYPMRVTSLTHLIPWFNHPNNIW
jgi:hypothetical protein